MPVPPIASAPHDDNLWRVGDTIPDSVGILHVCVVAGNPGKWAQIPLGQGLSTPIPESTILAQSIDPVLASAGSANSSGSFSGSRLKSPVDITFSKILWYVHSAGVTPVAGQNEVGVLDGAGQRLAAVNVDSEISSVGLKISNIPPITMPSGVSFFVGAVFNAATPPSLSRTSTVNSNTLINAGLPSNMPRSLAGGAGNIGIPASFNLASTTNLIIWFAVAA